MNNIILEPENTILMKEYGPDLWFCRYCKSFWYWDESKKFRGLRLRQKDDDCRCREYKEAMFYPKPDIVYEIYEEEMTFFPDTPSAVTKMVQKQRVKIVPKLRGLLLS